MATIHVGVAALKALLPMLAVDGEAIHRVLSLNPRQRLLLFEVPRQQIAADLPKDAHFAEELLPGWDCLNEYTLQRLRGPDATKAPAQPALKGSTDEEHFNDRAKKTIGQ